MRILTRTQYDAICDIVMEQKKRIEELEAENKKKDDTIEYLNMRLFDRSREIMKMRKKLNDNGLTWTETGVDFPATVKVV